MERSFWGAAGLGMVPLAGAAPGPETSIIPTKLEDGEKLKVGILGCGARSPAHIKAINHYSGMEITALCDIIPEKMEEKKALIAEGRPEPRLYTDYEKMLKQDGLHAIAIVLPNTLHREASIASLDAGKHVLCEKPLTIDAADTRDIIKAVDRNRRVLQVGTQSRHSPDYAALAKKIHDEGLVGNVLYAWLDTFRIDWRKLHPDPEKDSEINWRMKQSEGGAIVYEMGIHSFDAFNWFIGSEPVEISAMGGVHNERLEERDSWDHAGVIVRYANGALATYGGNLYSCGGPGDDVLFGDKASLRIGPRGSSRTKRFTCSYWRPHGMAEDPRADSAAVELPEVTVDPSTSQWGYFLESVQGKKPPFPSARHHLPAVQIARGALASMAEGRHIPVAEIP